MNRAYGYRIYRLYFDNENRFDITLRRRIWHLATCNQGHVITIFGKSSSRAVAERRAVSSRDVPIKSGRAVHSETHVSSA